MPGLYSWSCKSYKNGFVWHDLAEDDLVLPTNGNEYVLKGSELLDQSPSAAHLDWIHQGNGNPRTPISKPKQQENSALSTTQEFSFSPASAAIKDPRPPPPPSPLSPPSPREDEHSAFATKAEFQSLKPFGAADASTQTEDGGEKNPARGRATRVTGISTDDGSLDLEFDRRQPSVGVPRFKDGPGTGEDEISPPMASPSASSSSGKTRNLESFIRPDAGKITSFRILEEEEVLFPTGPKLRPTNVLVQLVTCGSISVKDHHSVGLIPTCKPRFSHAKFPSSPMFSGSVMFGELDCLSEDRRLVALRLEDKECFSGSLIETKKHKDTVGEIMPALKRSSSYNADRNCRTTPDSKQDIAKLVDSSRSKCLPRALKHSSNKQPRAESFRSCSSDGPRKSSAGPDCRESPKGESQMIASALPAGAESLKEKGVKLIKIEERLISRARVTIQSRAPCVDS